MSKEHDDCMEEIFFLSSRYVEDTHHSPSAKYTLEIAGYKCDKDLGSDNISQGVVRCGERIITVVNRDSCIFPFAWAEQHPNGHDYLLCSEAESGQTVIELDTGVRRDYVPMPHGEDYYWAVYSVSPNSLLLAVDGCYWACPYEVRIFDFSEPLALPLKVTWNLSAWWKSRDVRKFIWNADNSLEFHYEVEYNPEMKKTLDQMTEEEQSVHRKGKNGLCWRVRAVWRFPDQEQVLETQIIGPIYAAETGTQYHYAWENWHDTPKQNLTAWG